MLYRVWITPSHTLRKLTFATFLQHRLYDMFWSCEALLFNQLGVRTHSEIFIQDERQRTLQCSKLCYIWCSEAVFLNSYAVELYFFRTLFIEVSVYSSRSFRCNSHVPGNCYFITVKFFFGLRRYKAPPLILISLCFKLIIKITNFGM